VPIVVVGNITVGGTGKTPFVIWLARFLLAHGHRPGIVSRGVGGKKHIVPYHVKLNSLVDEVGDEALLLAKNTACPVVLGIDRPKAVANLLQHFPCDIVLSDDGLQHYRLGRDLEIAVVDGERLYGNTQLLPAGPLREPLRRLQNVDFVVINGETNKDEFVMKLEPQEFISVKDPKEKIHLQNFPYKKIHAVAGIGHPDRFFSLLKKMGFEIIPHVFRDHYLFQKSDLNFSQAYPIVMTEKDAVKCESFADERFWYLAVNAKIDKKLETKIKNKIDSLLGESI